FTHRPLPSCENICFTERSPIALLDELQAQEGKDIWICGGAQIIRTLMEDDRIDVYQLTIVPVLLGAGIPLFERPMDPCRLRLIETTVQGDVVELRYGRSFHICRM
ncbi:MAG: dihydrofolate reductase family protein, partial [Merdibacter sp.]